VDQAHLVSHKAALLGGGCGAAPPLWSGTSMKGTARGGAAPGRRRGLLAPGLHAAGSATRGYAGCAIATHEQVT